MTVLTSFNERLKRKREKEESDKALAYFIEMFGHLSKEEKLEILKAIEDKDEKRYMELTEPIILRRAMLKMSDLLNK